MMPTAILSSLQAYRQTAKERLTLKHDNFSLSYSANKIDEMFGHVVNPYTPGGAQPRAPWQENAARNLQLVFEALCAQYIKRNAKFTIACGRMPPNFAIYA